jgi:hypothetical protein
MYKEKDVNGIERGILEATDIYLCYINADGNLVVIAFLKENADADAEVIEEAC